MGNLIKLHKWQKWDDLDSSNISSMAFLLTNAQEDIGLLNVTFKNGKKYSYPQVPKKLVTEVLESESIGKAFNKLIKPFYPGTKHE